MFVYVVVAPVLDPELDASGNVTSRSEVISFVNFMLPPAPHLPL